MFERELEVAETLARSAGSLALSLQGCGTIQQKANGQGPVSEGDLQTDDLIRAGLRRNFPQDRLISEESFQDDQIIPSLGRVWYVDPIDGTQEYVEGGSAFSVLIGLAIDSVPVVGVVFEPVTGLLWRGRPGLSERVDREGLTTSIDLSQHNFGPEGPVLALSHSVSSRFTDYIVQKLPFSKIIRKSSVGLKIALILDGKADMYLASARRIKLWDTCGPAAILLASKGCFSGFDGSKIRFGDKIQHGIEIRATTPHGANWLQGRLQRVIEEWIALRKIERPSS